MIPRAPQRSNRLPGPVTYFAIDTQPVWKDTAWLGCARPLNAGHADAAPASTGACALRSRDDRDLDRQAGEAAMDSALRASGAPPFVSGTRSPFPPRSVAHSGGRGAAVVHRDPDRRVGIDLEPRGAVNPDFAHYFTTPAERARCPFAEPTVLWTLKEAAWKAFDCDVSVPFHDLEIVFTGRGHVRGVRLLGRLTAARCLILVPWPGWILSVLCVEDAP